MEKSGTSYLPLHYGKPPELLFKKIVRMTGYISEIICQTYGTGKFLDLMADPIWFHSLSLVTGFDWNSSGTTTTTLHALKEYSRGKDLSFYIAGGKGKHMKDKKTELLQIQDNLSSSNLAVKINKESDYAAKIDSSLLQDGYDLYIHSVIGDFKGNYSVVQQGMNEEDGMARRYHWKNIDLSDSSIVDRNGINSMMIEDNVLDLSSHLSEASRKAILKTIREKPKFTSDSQYTLDNFDGNKILNLSIQIPWKKISQIYEYEPTTIHDLVSIPGIGKSAIRAICYIAEVIMGETPSREDPIRYSFAVGGKDGIPKPVDHHDYDLALEFYGDVLKNAGIENRNKLLEKLSRQSMKSTGYSIIKTSK